MPRAASTTAISATRTAVRHRECPGSSSPTGTSTALGGGSSSATAAERPGCCRPATRGRRRTGCGRCGGGRLRVRDDVRVGRPVGSYLIEQRTGRRLLPQPQPVLYLAVVEGIEVDRSLLGVLQHGVAGGGCGKGGERRKDGGEPHGGPG